MGDKSNISIKVISDFKEFQPLNGRWNNLVEQMDYPLAFLVHEWIASWWESFGQNLPVRIFTGWRDEKLIGALPLFETEHRLGAVFRFRGYQSMTNDESPGFGILCHPDLAGQFLAAVKDHLERNSSAWDVLFCLRFQGTEKILETIRHTFTAGHTRLLVNLYPGSYLIPLENNFKSFFQELSKGFSKNRRYYNNKIARLGKLDFRHTTDFNPTVLEEFYQIEKTGWKKGTSILTQPRKKLFYDSLAGHFARRGEHLLVTLYLNQHPIASVFGIIYNQTFFFLKIGIDYHVDEQIQKTSPGQVLLQHLIEHCHALGLKRFDFCGPFYEYERMWTGNICQKYNLMIFNQRKPLVKLYLACRKILK